MPSIFSPFDHVFFDLNKENAMVSSILALPSGLPGINQIFVPKNAYSFLARE
jgi:hypothetical protein